MNNSITEFSSEKKKK